MGRTSFSLFFVRAYCPSFFLRLAGESASENLDMPFGHFFFFFGVWKMGVYVLLHDFLRRQTMVAQRYVFSWGNFLFWCTNHTYRYALPGT